MQTKLIISLFDYTGNWSKPYKDNGYNVIQIDIKHGIDILNWNYKVEKNVYGILAAPDCTNFSGSGARWWPEKDRDGRTDYTLSLIDKTLEIVDYFSPSFWVIENPVGRLNKLRPQLKKYGPKYFQPYWYGEPYTKKTGLWGKFNFPDPTNVVEPTEGSKMWKLPPSPQRKELRSTTPMGFAQAFYENNK